MHCSHNATSCGHPKSPDCLFGLCPHNILCSLGLDKVVPTIILYFCPLTAYMPPQDIEQLTSLSSAGPHIWVFCCRMPPPLLRVQGCYTLQLGPGWGTSTHHWLCPINKCQALGLPCFALVTPLTRSRLLHWLRRDMGYAIPFLFFRFFLYVTTQLHSRILSTIRTTRLLLDSVSTQRPTQSLPHS